MTIVDFDILLFFFNISFSVVNPKVLIPHLIYFVTCNSEILTCSTVVLKHLIFLMAVCILLKLLYSV